jgi:hypothetical protein
MGGRRKSVANCRLDPSINSPSEGRFPLPNPTMQRLLLGGFRPLLHREWFSRAHRASERAQADSDGRHRRPKERIMRLPDVESSRCNAPHAGGANGAAPRRGGGASLVSVFLWRRARRGPAVAAARRRRVHRSFSEGGAVRDRTRFHAFHLAKTSHRRSFLNA